MTHAIQPRPGRQRGITLIELMVGMAIGLLVVLAALGSLVMTRGAARAMTGSASLEQKVSLAMLQIGQQISQAGAVVANSNQAGAAASYLPYISFNVSALGGVNGAVPDVSIYGVDGGANPDHLVVSYSAPNDRSSGPAPQAFNCVGNAPVAAGSGQRVVSQFFINASAATLVCNDDAATPSSQSAQPLASNVKDLKVQYLLVDGNHNVTLQNASPTTAWSQVVGIQACLEMQSDPIQAQAPDQTTYTDCRGNSKSNTDGRVHRIVRQTFYLRNING